MITEKMISLRRFCEPMTAVDPMDEETDPVAPDGWTLTKKKRIGIFAAFEEPQVDEEGNPIIDEGTGQQVTKTIYQIYVDDNGDEKMGKL